MTSISTYIINNAESLAVEIVENVLGTLNLNIPQWEKDQAISMYVELMGFLGNSLIQEKEELPEGLLIWSERNGERQASSEEKISDIIVRYSPTREVLTDIVTRICIEFEATIEETTYIIKRTNTLLDFSVNQTVIAYERLTDKMFKENQKEMAELSAAIVLVKEGVAVLPLIGTMNSYRADYILEKVVPKISKLEIKHLIADFSGLKTIDPEMAYYLHQIGNVLRLLGIIISITGIRPELAQTAVNSGINLSAIRSFRHVKQAIESLQ
ncbi:STAS domain-containing protein [Mesobacillus harenae]|uniref:STAS domain-containing protein n=1 Tax=Mesobacillus harenae TaxID=2213203 RepID=UPI00157FC1A0|nr:STAS domain-containing protein [Mesobacillus harenae]